MEKKSLKDLILFLIYGHDGAYTWYQLERELDLRGLGGGHISSLDLVELLITEGLVIQKEHLNQSAIPWNLYYVTEEGKKRAYELVKKHGFDYFMAEIQNRDDYEL